MTEPGFQPDDSALLSRRDLLRLGAASLGAPLLSPQTTSPPASGQTVGAQPETTPAPDFPGWEAFPAWKGDDYPGHPDPRARTVNNLKFMALAMHNFAAANGSRFPAPAIRKGNQPILSWRVAILPYLEQFALYERFHLDEPWDSPHNASLLKEMPDVYAPVTVREASSWTTHYQRIISPGSLFAADEGTLVADSLFAQPTLMIVEAAESVPWTKPADLRYDDANPLLNLGGPFENGSHAAFADGSVRFVSKDHSPETLRVLITHHPRSGRNRR